MAVVHSPTSVHATPIFSPILQNCNAIFYLYEQRQAVLKSVLKEYEALAPQDEGSRWQMCGPVELELVTMSSGKAGATLTWKGVGSCMESAVVPR